MDDDEGTQSDQTRLDSSTLESSSEPHSKSTPTTQPNLKTPNTETDASLFYTHFQSSSAHIQSQISSLSSPSLSSADRTSTVETCLFSIARLSAEVKDAGAYVPAYDQRAYADALRALGEDLARVRRQVVPRKKFAFKGRIGAAAVVVGSGSAAESGIGVGAGQGSEGVKGASRGERAAGEDSLKTVSESQGSEGGVIVSAKSEEWVGLPAVASTAMTTGTVSGIRRCVVDLMHSGSHSKPETPATSNKPTFASLQLRDIKQSLILAGTVSGPTHITNLHDCVLVVSCRQFRMHSCTSVDVYLQCSSRPIIEDCKDIKFAPLPESFRSGHDPANDMWSRVDDFKWIKAEPSPHWSVMVDDDRLREESWARLVDGRAAPGVEETLRAVGIS